MPQTYYSIITNNGLIKNAQASVNNVSLDLTQIAVGDANGTNYDPQPTDSSLQNELYRTSLSHVVLDENNPSQLIIEGVISEEIGPFFVREIGIFDANGDLFAIGKFPETFKPNLPSGVGKKLYIRMILGFANDVNVTLIVSDINNDPNFSTHVNDEFARADGELSNRLKISENFADLDNAEVARNNLELKNGAVSDLTGAVIPFSMITPPSGWLECNGASLSRATYADLFSKIGDIYGSDDINSFKIPDLRGEFVRGWDNQKGIDQNRLLGSKQDQDWKSFNMWNSYGATNSYSHGPVYMNKYTSHPGNVSNLFGGHWASPSGRIGLYWDSSETRPRNISLMYCIKY